MLTRLACLKLTGPSSFLEFEDVCARAIKEGVECGAKDFDPGVVGAKSSFHKNGPLEIDRGVAIPSEGVVKGSCDRGGLGVKTRA